MLYDVGLGELGGPVQLVLGSERLTLLGGFKCLLQLQLLGQDQCSDHRHLLTVLALLKVTQTAQRKALP